MPAVNVVFYREASGTAPVVEWLEVLKKKDKHGFPKCAALIQRLAREGHELRRPAASFLRDGLHALRAKSGRVHYRVRYFFHVRGTAVLLHALTKEAEVPRTDMGRALRRQIAFKADPQAHVHEEERG